LTIKPISSRRALAFAAAGLLAAGLAACSSSSSSTTGAAGPSTSASSGASSSSTAGNSTGSGATLVMESSPENSITQDFNPFVSTAAPQGMGATGLIYEPLYQFDLANPTIQYPWLATSYKWGNGGKSITFTIRQGVKWNNGTALTPADVAFTYNYIKKNASINLAGLAISSVTTSGDTVTVSFPTAQYTNLENIAGVAILPQSVWGSVATPATFTDANPVGTGPYTLGSFTPEGFTLVKNPNYWQASKVQVPKVYFPVYTSNTGALSALFSGQIDWTGNYIPGLQKDFVDTSPATHHYWEAAGSSNALWPNLNTWPTNQLAVRKAIDLAINRSVIGAEGESGLESALTNASGITLPTYQAWAGPVASDTLPATGDVAAAKQVLTQAGYKMGSNGFFQLNGKTLALTLVDPSSYTDYAQDDALVAQQLRAAGIDVTFDGLTVNAWNADVADGNFQLTLHWGSGGVTPYNLYDNWLDDSLISSTGATGDFERLKDPAIEADLAKLSGAATVAAQTAALAPIEKFVVNEVPVIPTTTAADWFEYNSQHYNGWPTQSNPYDSGQPSGTNNGPGTGSDEVVILHLTPAS
jgi:peptide/nickel transport system substrate-binding protein